MLQRGAVCIPSSASRVTDADEEVFLLYTNLASQKSADGTTRFRGLGHIDSHEDVLTISLNIGRPAEEQTGKADDIPAPPSNLKHKHRRASKRKVQGKRHDEIETIEVEIVQDKTALRSRKGDTGSVLWHASVDFAEVILRQLHRRSPYSFFIPEPFASSHVVELGAGTGLLGVVLSPFVRHYTVTDIEELVPLIRKNVARNFSVPSASSRKLKSPAPGSPQLPPPEVVVTALDWVQLHNTSVSLRPRLVPAEPADIVLVVDCIYHPSLLPALLTTIDYLTIPDKTAVVVVVELRAEDVIREFLQGWLEKSSQGEWELWSVGDLLEGPYAVWVGWKNTLSRDEGVR
ncbi:hypothetical protein V8D89_003062 [Ganoderma adspersum]